MVAVEQVDDAFEDAVADGGANVGFAPVGLVPGVPDDGGIGRGAGELGDEFGVVGSLSRSVSAGPTSDCVPSSWEALTDDGRRPPASA